MLALSGREWCSASTPVTDNLQVLHEFRETDGQGPTVAVTQWSDGWFYGVTGRRRRLRPQRALQLLGRGPAGARAAVIKAGLSALLLAPSTIAGAASATRTVTLTATAPAGGARVTLTSSSRSVSVRQRSRSRRATN